MQALVLQPTLPHYSPAHWSLLLSATFYLLLKIQRLQLPYQQIITIQPIRLKWEYQTILVYSYWGGGGPFSVQTIMRCTDRCRNLAQAMLGSALAWLRLSWIFLLCIAILLFLPYLAWDEGEEGKYFLMLG